MTVYMLPPNDSSDGLRFGYKVRGAIGLVAGLVTIRLMPLWMLEFAMRQFRRIARDARHGETVRLIQAVRWASRVYPWRAACLEVSLGVCLASLLTLRMPTWCVGTRFRPVQQHAWVEVDGKPVSEPEADAWPYRPLIQI